MLLGLDAFCDFTHSTFADVVEFKTLRGIKHDKTPSRFEEHMKSAGDVERVGTPR